MVKKSLLPINLILKFNSNLHSLSFLIIKKYFLIFTAVHPSILKMIKKEYNFPFYLNNYLFLNPNPIKIILKNISISSAFSLPFPSIPHFP